MLAFRNDDQMVQAHTKVTSTLYVVDLLTNFVFTVNIGKLNLPHNA